jgi:N,N'-diacetyllegionaminate synthase
MPEPLVIAEAGVNHNGNLETALELVDAAAEAGADVVKFQTFRAETVASKNAQKAEYQKSTSKCDETQYQMLKRLELNDRELDEIVTRCNKRKIEFCSTPFDLLSIRRLKRYKLPFWKIPSGEITNVRLLREIAKIGQPIVLSSGMSYLYEIGWALRILEAENVSRKMITVLHCTSSYPVVPEEVNLNAMVTIGKAFQVHVGYSDHTLGIEIPIAAAALGARMIEKHFTLSNKLQGPDHAASLEPNELANMICAIRKVKTALGSNLKQPYASEMENRNLVRKSIVASRAIKKGEVFTEENIVEKRPGTGISPIFFDYILGRRADRNYRPDEQIS